MNYSFSLILFNLFIGQSILTFAKIIICFCKKISTNSQKPCNISIKMLFRQKDDTATWIPVNYPDFLYNKAASDHTLLPVITTADAIGSVFPIAIQNNCFCYCVQQIFDSRSYWHCFAFMYSIFESVLPISFVVPIAGNRVWLSKYIYIQIGVN